MHGDDERKHKRGKSPSQPTVACDFLDLISERWLVTTEAAMMGRCKHPHICQSYDTSERMLPAGLAGKHTRTPNMPLMDP